MNVGIETLLARRNSEAHSDTMALLETAGLREADLDIFRQLNEAGFSSFLHGSLTAGNLRERSDVDFALVGEFTGLPPSSVLEEYDRNMAQYWRIAKPDKFR